MSKSSLAVAVLVPDQTTVSGLTRAAAADSLIDHQQEHLVATQQLWTLSRTLVDSKAKTPIICYS
jgi:hypothetical protein